MLSGLETGRPSDRDADESTNPIPIIESDTSPIPIVRTLQNVPAAAWDEGMSRLTDRLAR